MIVFPLLEDAFYISSEYDNLNCLFGTVFLLCVFLVFFLLFGVMIFIKLNQF